MTNYRGLMAENTRCVVNSLVFLVTMFGNNVFTLFNLSSANNNLMFIMTLLFMHGIEFRVHSTFRLPEGSFLSGCTWG